MHTITLNCNRLIECRKKLGITKQEAARRIQISQPAYLRYETGERTPSIHVIYFMAIVLETSVDYLLGKTDNPSPNSCFINADTDPELFTFVELYYSSDLNTRKRMENYFNKISTIFKTN